MEHVVFCNPEDELIWKSTVMLRDGHQVDFDIVTTDEVPLGTSVCMDRVDNGNTIRIMSIDKVKSKIE